MRPPVGVWGLALLSLSGCGGGDERARPVGASEVTVATATASQAASAAASMSSTAPSATAEDSADDPTEESSAPVSRAVKVKVPDETTVLMRLRGCRMGFVGLRLAREAYLGSLGSKRPGPGLIPTFGVKPPANSTRPVALPYSRHVRNCKVAAALKAAVMDAHRQFAQDAGAAGLDLSDTLTAANSYYFKQDYLQDGFQVGQDLHDKLLQGFKAIDPSTPPLDAALRALEGARPPGAHDTETRRLSEIATEAALRLAVSLEPKPDMRTFRSAAAQLSKQKQAMEDWQNAHSSEKDVFAKATLPVLTILESQTSAFKTTTPSVEERVEILNACAKLIEADYRAEIRALQKG